MPFTTSHMAAVIPFTKTRLPYAALAIGSMTPDMPLFFGTSGYKLLHSAQGLISANLVLGIFLTLMWIYIVKKPMSQIVPKVLLSWVPKGPDNKSFLGIAMGVFIGAATHIIWDHFTHGYGWPVGQLEILRQKLAGTGIPLYSFLQHLSSGLGAGALLLWAGLKRVKSLKAQLDHQKEPRLFSDGILFSFWLLIIPGAMSYAWFNARVWTTHIFLYDLSVGTAQVLMVVCAVFVVLFHLFNIKFGSKGLHSARTLQSSGD